jgi:pSer/pThr/pTyr-binding forkhead associated (FHA) protein
MAKLVLLSEGLTGRTCELKAEKTTIGRVEDNNFCIAESSVSSHHCEIILKGDQVTVKDLDSTNGTFIDREKISEAPLKPGQILRLGQIEMRLETGAPAAATAASKKLEQTMVIPQGVKLNELEGTRPVFDKNSPFAKKTNKTNMVFIAIGGVLVLAIIAAIVLAFMKFGQIGGQ